MGGKVGIVKKHFPHGGKGGSKCGLKHLDEIQTLTYQNFRQSTDFENQSEEWKNELITPVNFMARYAPPLGKKLSVWRFGKKINFGYPIFSYLVVRSEFQGLQFPRPVLSFVYS